MDLFHLLFQYRVWFRSISARGNHGVVIQGCPDITYSFALYSHVHLRMQIGTISSHTRKRSPEYKKILYGPDAAKKKPLFVVIVVWIFCAVLYVGQVSPVAFFLANKASGLPVNEVWAWIGAAFMAIGVILESLADAQKKAAKKINKHRFVDTGLYRLVRCPNYLGELVIWTGSFIVCFGACCAVWQWIIAAIGYAGIVYVMFSGARRLEIRQNLVYGNDPEYQAYIKKTPILLPFVPIYSVEKHKWLQA